jgi:hypothetical protein
MRARRVRGMVVGAAGMWGLGCVLGCNSLLGNDAWTLASDAAGTDGPFVGSDSGSRPGSDSGSAGSRDSAAGVDTGAFDSSVPSFDSGSFDTGTTAMDTGLPNNGLSAELVLPPSSGQVCLPQQGDGDCPTGETCRIDTPNAGRCDVYATSGGVGGWPCTVDSDCNDTLQCYNGECFVLCPLGMTCTGGCECFQVGSETTGLCCPGM